MQRQRCMSAGPHTRPPLAARCPRCAAQVSLGLVLATLLLWRQQLRELQRLAARKAQVSEAAAAEASEELLRSPFVRLCEPTLRLADAYGTWAVPVGFAALAAFIAALLGRPGAAGA